MIEITPSNHAKVLNASLTKLYSQARIKGKLESVELYIFNILFHYISNCGVELTSAQMKKLQCIYRIMYNTSKDICKTNLEGYATFTRSKFVVPNKNTPIKTPVISKVYYWQEPTPFTEYTDIVDAITNDNYLDGKIFTTKESFTLGLEMPLTHIGRIVLVFDPSFASSQFVIKDYLGNDITHAFTKTVISNKNMVVFVSENIHSFGLFKLSGVEIPGAIDIHIFNNVFNNTFA